MWLTYAAYRSETLESYIKLPSAHKKSTLLVCVGPLSVNPMPTFNLTTAFYCILLLAANVAASRPAIHTTAPIIDLGYAKYQGFIDDQVNITRFLGIRYAAQPLGKICFFSNT